MERDLHSPSTYDYRQYDRVWRRVAPDLEPYPDMADLPGQPTPAENAAAVPAPAAEEQLPGAQMDPCCMGTAAMEMVDVIQGFIEEELADCRYYQAFARQAPSWARQHLRQLATEEGNHARRLMAVYYLITGSCYRPAVSCERIRVGEWCASLRERYHAEACGGFNYARAQDSTTDPCLEELLGQLSADEYRHAELLMRMLERSLSGRSSC